MENSRQRRDAKHATIEPMALSALRSVKPQHRSPARELEAGKRVGSTVNTMKVLDFVVRNGGATTTEIARATAINPSTCFNIARTLTADGYLSWTAETKRYQVGPALTGLAHQLTLRRRGLENLRPAMQRIANDYQLTVTLWRRCSLSSMALEMVAESGSALRIQMPVGQHLPVLLGGMGRILALRGGLTDEQRLAIFKRIKWGRPLPFSVFMEQARQAQRRGYGLDEGFTHRAVTAVAVAVPSAGERVEEVVSATMFLDQHRAGVLKRLVGELRQLASDVGTAASGA
jgi:DNA-binding IclR family transcriptional regulator